MNIILKELRRPPHGSYEYIDHMREKIEIEIFKMAICFWILIMEIAIITTIQEFIK